MLKLINRYHKSLVLKITRISKAQTKIPLTPTIEKTWCRQERKIIEQFVQFLVHTDMKSTKRGKLQEKTPKITQSWSNQFWIPIGNGSVTLQLEKPSIENLKYRWKNSFQYLRQQYPSNKEVKEKLLLNSLFYVWTIFEHRIKDM